MASKGLQKYSGKHVAIAERIPGIGIHLPGVVGFWLRMAGEVPIILDCASAPPSHTDASVSGRREPDESYGSREKFRAGFLIWEPGTGFERLLPGVFPGRGLPGSGK